MTQLARKPLGVVVINDHAFRIDRLRLQGGGYTVVFTIPEGVVDFGDGTIMIFGEDGELVIKGLMDERWHDKPADILWTYTYTFIVDDNRSVRVRAREGI